MNVPTSLLLASSVLSLILIMSSLLVVVIVVDAQTTTTTNSSNSTANTTTTMTPTTTTGNGNITTTTTTTMSPGSGSQITTNTSTSTTSASPLSDGLGPVDTRPIRNVTCPFSRWQGEPRYCYECRWCPFRQSTCCEMEDEIAVLKSVNVSGSQDWDCFITIVHFQQCGRCDPRSVTFLMNKTLNYVWDPRGVSIRPCKQACKYIYKQCKDAKTLTGQNVVPDGQGETEFCADYPELSSDEVPCFESAGAVSFYFLLFVIAVLLMFVF